MGDARRKASANTTHDNQIVFALSSAEKGELSTLLIAVPPGAEELMRREIVQNVDLSKAGIPLVLLMQGVKDRTAALALLGTRDSSSDEAARKADWIVLGVSPSPRGKVLVFLLPESAWARMRCEGLEHNFDLSKRKEVEMPLRVRIWAVKDNVTGLEEIHRFAEGKAVHELFDEDLAIEEPGYERRRRRLQ